LMARAAADAVQTAFAIEAFGVAANPHGPGNLTALNKQQLQDLFDGKINNWSEVGGDNQRVVPINRVAGSGTRQTLANFLFQGDATRFAVGDSEEESQQVARAVSQTPGAISYLGSAFLNGANLVPLYFQDGNTLLTLNKSAVQSGTWPIGGPGACHHEGTGNALEAAFLDYLIGQSFEADPVWDNLGYVAPSSPAVGKPAAN